MHYQTFSFHGIAIKLSGDSPGLIEEIERDFSYFKIPVNKAEITINTYGIPPPYDTLPAMQASYTSPRNTCYYHKGLKYIDYSGKGLVVFDAKDSTCHIYSNDAELLHEICYMCILSLVNEKLERCHIHRVHALGLAVDNKAVLILLDMGGGKSTLAIRLLSFLKSVKLISEDSPLINSQGQILPFPIRIGLHQQDVPPQIPKDLQRYFKRSEFSSKILIDIEYWKDQICFDICQPRIIIVGKRVIGKEPEIKQSSYYIAFREFIKNSVIGVGLYQGIEYIFQKGLIEVFKKIPAGISRLNNSLKVINNSEIFEFYLSADKEKNNEILVEFLKAIETKNE